jgi:predicted nucleotidyltransferase
MEANFAELLPVLVQHGVRFIVIGGGAAIAHGSARLTSDVDVVYSRELQNIRNLAAALQNYAPYLLPFSEEMNVFGRCRFVTLEKLIQLKRAAGRPKDFEAIAELQALLEERRRAQ